MAGLKLFSQSDWRVVRERARPKSASLMKHSELRRILLGWVGGVGGGREGGREGESERERENKDCL